MKRISSPVLILPSKSAAPAIQKSIFNRVGLKNILSFVFVYFLILPPGTI